MGKHAAPAAAASSSTAPTDPSNPASIDPAFSHAGTSLLPLPADAAAAARHSNEAIAARIPRLRDAQEPMALTPLRAHYLKKTLVRLQVENEVSQLSERDILSTFGPPFKPSARASRTDLPILRFLFHHFLLTFPFLRSAPPNFFADKVQVFYDRFLERNISGTDDREEESKRRKLGGRFTKWVVLLMGAAIHLKGGSAAEEVLKIADEDRERMAAAQARMKAALAGAPVDPGHGAAAFDVNVVGVRVVHSKKGRLGRTRAHEEFLIRTRRAGFPDVYVSRRYGDFNRLADTLRLEFPEEEIGRPPAKDRREVVGLAQEAPAEADPWRGNNPLAGKDGAATPDGLAAGLAGTSLDGAARDPPARKRTLSTGANSTSSRAAAAAAATSANGSRSAPGSPSGQKNTLAREKNRLTLRAYLRGLLAVQQVADSPSLSSFLLGEPITLSLSEEADIAAREALDAVREDEAERFAKEASRRVEELRSHITAFKAELIKEDGLSRLFATIRNTPDIADLPESYRALIAWGRISAASTLFSLFMGSDTSSDLFAQLKRMHGLMPYFVLRQILRISNPVSMIRGVLDLFLAQPFGQRSLLQRMFAGGLQEEVREISEMIEGVKVKVEDDMLCEKVRCFVYADVETQRTLRKQAEEERLDLITVILRCPDLPGAPKLNRPQIHRVVKASRAYEVYKEYRDSLRKGEEDEGPDAVDADAWLYEDLHVLMRSLTRLRDKEQMISLVFEGVTSELLKDIVTIFYSPLAQVYKAANIADSLSDLQAFINDLIKTVESSEELSYTDPQRTVQVFIDLVQRHEGRFYAFVHQVHSKGSGLFNGLMHWIELFINFVRGPDGATGGRSAAQRGVGEIDLEICMPAGGEERKKALEEIDAVVVHAYRLKMVRDLKLRRRLVNKEVSSAAKKLLSAEASSKGNVAGAGAGNNRFGIVDDDHAFVSAMVDNLGVGDAFTGELEDVEAEEFDEDDDDEEEDEDDDDDGNEVWSDASAVSLSESDAEEVLDEGEGEDAARTAAEDVSARLDAEASGDKLSATQSVRWKPPPPGRSFSELTARAVDLNKDLPPPPPPASTSHPHAHGGEDGQQQKKRRRLKAPPPPTLEVLPTMVPFFVEMVRGRLRPARSASASSLVEDYDPYNAGAGGGGTALGTGTGAGRGTTTEENPAPRHQPGGGWFS